MCRNLTLVFIILVLLSCGKDVVIIEEPNLPPDVDEIVEVNLIGFTTDEERFYIPQGDIEMEGQSVSSDETGFFHLEKVLIGKKGKIVKIKKNNYLPSIYRVVNHQDLENIVLNLSMIQSPDLQVMGASGGAIISDNGVLNVPENTISENTNLTFATFVGDKANSGNSDALLFGVKTEYLLKEASIYLDGTSPLGENLKMEVQLDAKDFKTANISDLSIFQFDNVALTWKEKNLQLNIEGSKISFDIDGYGWWTVAKKVPAQYSKITLQQNDGTKISKAESQISFSEHEQNKTSFYTSASGSISTYFPKDLSINVSLNNNEFKTVLLSGFTEDLTEASIEFDVVVQVAFEGNVYDCEFEYSDGYVALITQGQHKIKEVKNGSFTGEVFLNDDDVVIQFYNTELEFLRDQASTVEELQSEINNFFSCSDLSDNLSVLNGAELFQDFDVCRVKVRPKETVVIGEKDNGEVFLVSFSGEKEGVYDGLIYFPLITDEAVQANVKVNIILFDQLNNKLGGFIKTEYISSGDELMISFIGNIE